jgi:hypothetical protein
MLLHYIDEAILNRWDAGEPVAGPDADQEIEAWDKEMEARGILVGGGRLQRTAEATTLTAKGGEVLVTDGPYAETKEQIAGYCVLECADLAEAIEVSLQHPSGRIGTFELRPYVD